MKKHELEALQAQILKRIAGDDEPVDRDAFYGYRETMDLYRVSKGKSAFLDFATILNHEQAAKYIRAISAFYEAATPADIEILNAQTYVCSHCNEALTDDEFYPVTSTPDKPGLNIITDQHRNKTFTAYCRKCIQVVPYQDFRKDRPGYVYLAAYNDVYKIGMSQNPVKRVGSLNGVFPGIRLLHYFRCADMPATETHVHSIHLHRYVYGEFFSLSDQEVARLIGEGGAK